MGMLLETLVFSVTAPGAGGAASALVGSSRIRDGSKGAMAVAFDFHKQDAGLAVVTAPSLHDTAMGYRLEGRQTERVGGTETIYDPTVDLIAPPLPMSANDDLQVTITGSSTVGAVEFLSLWVRYQDARGLDAGLVGASAVDRRRVSLCGGSRSIAGVAGEESPQVAIAGTVDRLKPNTEYAVLGATTGRLPGAALLLIRSPDWGNVPIGIPVNGSGSTFFFHAASALGLPLIPVFNSNARDITTVSLLCDDTVDGSLPLVINLAELSGTRR